MNSKQAIIFDVSDADRILIQRIGFLARPHYRHWGVKYPMLSARMDITACHANGCPLHLAAMLQGAKDNSFDFIHDLSGIYRNLNRDTGKLSNCFLPRFSRQ